MGCGVWGVGCGVWGVGDRPGICWVGIAGWVGICFLGGYILAGWVYAGWVPGGYIYIWVGICWLGTVRVYAGWTLARREVWDALRLERELFIDNLLVRIHFITEMIRWTGLAPWEFDLGRPAHRKVDVRLPGKGNSNSLGAMVEG